MLESRHEEWATTWAASSSGFQGEFTAPQSTIRQSMRLSAGGGAIRLRFVNPHTYAPLVFHAVTVALAQSSTPVLLSLPIPVRVEGAHSFAVHPGTVVLSDPIPLAVRDLETIAVSVFTQDPVAMSKHSWANRMSWSTLGNLGDLTMDPAGAAFRPFGFSWLWVDAVDVLGPDVGGALVALGDSITDGAGSDFGSDTRWPDLLAERFARLPAGDPRRRSVANAGIGGNTVGGLGTDFAGVNVLSRLERDALSLSGVTDVIVAAGSNDLFLGASHEALVGDLSRLAERIRSTGARALVATIVPRVGGYLWGSEPERHRQATNDWIRNQTAFDDFLDFASVLDDPQSPGRIRPEYDADRTHPSTEGYRAMAQSIDLDQFLATEGIERTASETHEGKDRR